MLAAELHGKVAANEDILTSHVFSIFRYISDLSIPLAFLSCARNLHNQALSLDSLAEAEVVFWPRFSLRGGSRWREADALLRLTDAQGRRVAVVVEAKCHSGLSNVPGGGVGGEEKSPEDDLARSTFGHQLADEFCGIKCGDWQGLEHPLKPGEARFLIYVTQHYEMPRPELEEAVTEITKRPCQGPDCRLHAENSIYWVSWRDLHGVLSQGNRLKYCNHGQGRLLGDLRQVLEARGLMRYSLSLSRLATPGAYERICQYGFWSRLVSVGTYEGPFHQDSTPGAQAKC
ncbi:MAG: hypothetical protein AB1446_07725 [Bacillota bacterium]